MTSCVQDLPLWWWVMENGVPHVNHLVVSCLYFCLLYILLGLQISEKWRKGYTLRCNGYRMWPRVGDWCMLWWRRYTILAKFTISERNVRWPRAWGRLQNSNAVMSSRMLRTMESSTVEGANRKSKWTFCFLGSIFFSPDTSSLMVIACFSPSV